MLSLKNIYFKLLGTLCLINCLMPFQAEAQCDFINDITGITQSILPIGDAADPSLYTQTYVLVDNQGLIYAINTSPDFLAVPAGFYNLYAVNYDNAEATAVLPLLAIGQPWFNVEVYGNDDVNYCLDYTPPFGSGCPIVVCEQLTICEVDTLNTAALNFETLDHEQNYCLVCNDVVLDISPISNFALTDYSAAVAGADCQLFGINFNSIDGNPLSIGDTWTTITDANCNNICFDFIGMELDITAISQPSGSGVSTTVDFWNGCLGAQPPVNGGNNFSETVNNWCVPAYDVGTISARPDETGNADDLSTLMGGQQFFSRVPCVGTMDLTQHTIFYTVECAPTGPAQLDVLISNAGPNISMIQAALYGPVNPACPTFTGGTFVDCNDAGVGSLSGNPMGDITLSTNGNPGEVYLVIVDTEDRDQFTISSNFTLLNNHLLLFTGEKVEQDNRIQWQTEQDDHVQHYVLERSVDAVQFDAIAQIEAQTNLSAIHDYEYLDLNPGTGTFYYRLKIIRTDASSEYSGIVVLSRDNDDEFSVKVYPNPAKDVFNVSFNSASAGTLFYEIRNVIGQQLKRGVFDMQVGPQNLELSVKDFAAATYVVSLTINGHRIQRKLIKQ